jgi:hypothetical protein
LRHFLRKKGPKTPENGPKSTSSDYLSVNSLFLQIVHYIILTLDFWLKKWLYDGRGVGVKAISGGFLLKIDLKKVFPKDIMRSWALILRKEITIHLLPIPEGWRATIAPWETGAESNQTRHPVQRDGATARRLGTSGSVRGKAPIFSLLYCPGSRASVALSAFSQEESLVPKRALSFSFDNTEFRGRFAGVG